MRQISPVRAHLSRRIKPLPFLPYSLSASCAEGSPLCCSKSPRPARKCRCSRCPRALRRGHYRGDNVVIQAPKSPAAAPPAASPRRAYTCRLEMSKLARAEEIRGIKRAPATAQQRYLTWIGLMLMRRHVGGYLALRAAALPLHPSGILHPIREYRCNRYPRPNVRRVHLASKSVRNSSS